MSELNNHNSSPPEGSLLAYIHNERASDGTSDETSETERALAASPELTEELDALNSLDALLQKKYGGTGRPPEQDLVDVVTGQASPTQRLIVAAYVRDSVRGQHELAELEKALAAQPRPTEQTLSLSGRLRLLVAAPLDFNLGLRGLADETKDQTFQVAELQAQVTLRIVPPIREQWQVEGYVTQNYMPVGETEVLLQSSHAAQPNNQQTRQSDDEGFFLFDGLDGGQYSLYIHLNNGILIVPDLDLTDADE